MNSPSVLHVARIAAIREVAIDTISLDLVSANTEPLPPFSAGSHIDIHLPCQAVRQYSIANDPGERGRYMIAVKRERNGRGGSICVHDQITVDDKLNISAPRNNFRLAEGEHRAHLIAGGIGITPILAMIAELRRRGSPWQLDYFARSEEHAAFREALRAQPDGTVREHFTEAVTSDFTPIVGGWEEGRHLYCCGPAGLMNAVREGARAWPSANLHFESFQAEAIDRSGDQPFEVELARQGIVLTVPADKSILETLRENGFDAPSSCEEGICGSCETTLLAGEPEHRDGLLTDEEIEANDRIMICVSRARGGRLVLDL